MLAMQGVTRKITEDEDGATGRGHSGRAWNAGIGSVDLFCIINQWEALRWNDIIDISLALRPFFSKAQCL